MQIKELILKNFKSFKYNAIPFKEGFHVIVGPNGSGKSNIIDALLFVFGATSLKRLRVDKLANLVNHNSKSKTARVRVVFEFDGDNYEIAREIDKEGKSVFYLNDKRKALNEITSFLDDIGISAEGYNTVQQGDVTRIINLKADERRKILEDVSGISLFDERKNEAEKNLKKVNKRLDKVSIALNERKPYVEQLSKEREDALKFKELDSKEKLYNYNLITQELKELENENQVYQDTIDTSSYDIEEINKNKKQLLEERYKIQGNIEEVNSKLINFSDNIQKNIGNVYSKELANKEILDNNLSLKKNNIAYIDNENKRLASDLSVLKSNSEDLKKLIINEENKLEANKNEEKILKEKIDADKQQYSKLKELQTELYEELSLINKKINSSQDSYFKTENKINAYNMQLESFNKEEEKDKNELKEVIVREKQLNKEIEDLNKGISSINKEIDTLKIKQEKKNKDILNIKEEIDNINLKLITFQKELEIGNNILTKIKDLKNKLNNFDSFVGFLNDCVNLDSSQKSYFSNYVVLKDGSEINKIIKELDVNTNLNFIILSILEVSKNELSSVINNVNKNKNVKKIKGFYFDGLSYKKILFKDSKLLENKIKEFKTKKEKLDSQLQKDKEKLDSLEKEISKNKDLLLNKNISYNTKKEILEDLNDKSSKLRVQKVNVNRKNIVENIGQLQDEIKTHETKIKELKTKKNTVQNQLSDIDFGSASNLRDKYDDLSSKINLLEQSLISKKSNLEVMVEKIDSKEKSIAENNRKLGNYSEEVNELEDKKLIINNKINQLKQELDKQELQKKQLFNRKSEFNERLNNLENKINNYNNKISELNSEINTANINLSSNSSRISQLESNLELLDLKDYKDIILEEELTISQLRSNLRSIRREKNALGNINFNAIDSYDKLAKEYHEISEKYDILIKEKDEVESMLSKINMKKESIFIDCFEKVNAEFKKIISIMSKSLSGDLELKGSKMLDSDLLINLTKGKKTKNIDIMSGGEKTITALAFIFAINAYKKLPFYILDEVDAALDDINSKNLMNYLKDLSKSSTIISITHNDSIVSGSDQIIGVTLKDNSSIIGLDLSS